MTGDRADAKGFSLGIAFWSRLVVLTFFSIAGLVYASDVLIPFALALLLFVLITAIVDKLTESLPGWLAHVAAVGIVIVGLIGILNILAAQAGAVAEAFPRYEARFTDILARVAVMVGDQNYAAAQEALSNLQIAEFASGAISSAGAFLSGFFLMLLYIPFMMVERRPMQKKMILATPDPALRDKVHSITNGMSLSLQRYIGIKTLVSLITGVASYAIMKPVGLDFAETWGVLAFMLNFIPTIGSIIGVALPSIVALVQFDTFTPFLIIAGGCGVVQFVVGNILEPSLTGRSLNLSPLMVIIALTFWTAIWGFAGAFLSVPITVCMLIMMSHVPATRSVAILMSGDGRLMTNEAPPEAETLPGKM